MNNNRVLPHMPVPKIYNLNIKQKSNPEDCMHYLKVLTGNRYAIKQLRSFKMYSCTVYHQIKNCHCL